VCHYDRSWPWAGWEVRRDKVRVRDGVRVRDRVRGFRVHGCVFRVPGGRSGVEFRVGVVQTDLGHRRVRSRRARGRRAPGGRLCRSWSARAPSARLLLFVAAGETSRWPGTVMEGGGEEEDEEDDDDEKEKKE